MQTQKHLLILSIRGTDILLYCVITERISHRESERCGSTSKWLTYMKYTAGKLSDTDFSSGYQELQWLRLINCVTNNIQNADIICPCRSSPFNLCLGVQWGRSFFLLSLKTNDTFQYGMNRFYTICDDFVSFLTA